MTIVQIFFAFIDIFALTNLAYEFIITAARQGTNDIVAITIIVTVVLTIEIFIDIIARSYIILKAVSTSTFNPNDNICAFGIGITILDALFTY